MFTFCRYLRPRITEQKPRDVACRQGRGSLWHMRHSTVRGGKFGQGDGEIMNSRRTWRTIAMGLSLGLVCALGGVCRAQDDGRRNTNGYKPRPQGVLGRLFAPKEEPPIRVTKGTPAKEDGDRSLANRPAIPRVSSKGDVVGQLEQERKNYLRRLDVCRKLREAAEETKNPALEQEADRLEQEAALIYQQRASRLINADMETTLPTKAEEKLLAEPTAPKLPRNDTAQVRTIRGDGPRSSAEGKE